MVCASTYSRQNALGGQEHGRRVHTVWDTVLEASLGSGKRHARAEEALARVSDVYSGVRTTQSRDQRAPVSRRLEVVGV